MPGILGRKVGMTRVVDENGNMVPLTVIECTPNTITQVKTTDKDGYAAIVVGYSELNRPSKNKKYRHIKEFKVENTDEFKVGDQITVEALAEAGKISFTSVSKGKGYQGVVKRHNFRTGPNSHGSKHHRHLGSLGGGTSSAGRVFKGKKQAGHMGSDKKTFKNVPLVLVDKAANIIGVKGPVPGGKNTLVTISF